MSPGGTTFHFIDEEPERALALARVSGGTHLRLEQVFDEGTSAQAGRGTGEPGNDQKIDRMIRALTGAGAIGRQPAANGAPPQPMAAAGDAGIVARGLPKVG